MVCKKKKNKRGSALDMKGLGMTLVVVGILAVVGVLIFARVDNSLESQIDQFSDTTVEVANESLTPLTGVSVAFANVPIDGCIDAYNNSVEVVSVNYTCSQQGFTLLDNYHNNSGAFTVSYRYNTTAAAWSTRSTIRSTVLDSMELGIIALLVLAAVTILAMLFMVGK